MKKLLLILLIAPNFCLAQKPSTDIDILLAKLSKIDTPIIEDYKYLFDSIFLKDYIVVDTLFNYDIVLKKNDTFDTLHIYNSTANFIEYSLNNRLKYRVEANIFEDGSQITLIEYGYLGRPYESIFKNGVRTFYSYHRSSHINELNGEKQEVIIQLTNELEDSTYEFLYKKIFAIGGGLIESGKTVKMKVNEKFDSYYEYGVWQYFDNNELLKEINWCGIDLKDKNNYYIDPCDVKYFYKNRQVKSTGLEIWGQESGMWHYYDSNGVLSRKSYFLKPTTYYDSNTGKSYLNRNEFIDIYYKPYMLAQNGISHGYYNENIIEKANEFFKQKQKVLDIEGVYSGTLIKNINSVMKYPIDWNVATNIEDLVILELDGILQFGISQEKSNYSSHSLLNELYFKPTSDKSVYLVYSDYCREFSLSHNPRFDDDNYKLPKKNILNNELFYNDGLLEFETIIDNIYYKLKLRKTHKPVSKVKISNNDKLVLPIKQVGNMKFITLTIGGKKYEYLIDTGASDMIINSDIEQHLLSLGILRKEDYTEPRTYEIANGEKIQLKRAKLYSINIAGYQFKDIEIAIGNESSSLLLGMSFLNKFDWKFNGNSIELILK